MNWAEQFNTYDEACIYYGVDTPAQVRAEQEYEYRLYLDDLMDRMMSGEIQPGLRDLYFPDETPF